MKSVYCYGMVHSSMVYLLKDTYDYPEANGYGEVDKIIPSAGGEAINTAIMLSKLNITSKIDGTWILKDYKNVINGILEQFSIDTSRLKFVNDNAASEIIIADGINRTCFGNFDSYKEDGKKWNSPNIEDIKKADMVALDPYLDEDSYTVAKTCKESNIPYVTIDSNYDDFLAMEAEAVIISKDHRVWDYPNEDELTLFNNYINHCKGLVIFTFGSNEVWYGKKATGLNKAKPYKIDPIDTTGAGDSYRAGIIYGLLNKMNDDETIKFANAVSACVCLSVPHAINACDLNGVKDFIKEYSYS